MKWMKIDFDEDLELQREAFAGEMRASWPLRAGVAIRQTECGNTELAISVDEIEGARWVSAEQVELAVLVRSKFRRIAAKDEGRIAFNIALNL